MSCWEKSSCPAEAGSCRADTPAKSVDSVASTARKNTGTSADIADAVAFVVSEEGRWLIGQTLQASGGIT